jgi:hypothetical protein
MDCGLGNGVKSTKTHPSVTWGSPGLNMASMTPYDCVVMGWECDRPLSQPVGELLALKNCQAKFDAAGSFYK